MATSGSAGGTYSGDSRYTLGMAISRAAVSGNSDSWNWSLTAYKASGTGVWDLDPQPWSINVGGYATSGSRAMDFRGVSSILIASGTTTFLAHDADGYLNISFSGSASQASLGSAGASGSIAANRIPKVPYAPAAPTFLSATASVLNFSIPAPADNGGSAILDYYMELRTSPGGFLIQDRTGAAGSQTFTGLSPNTNYQLRHRARNTIGDGAWSPYRQASTAVGLPSAPLNLSVDDLAPTSATLEWDTPTSTGGDTMTGYRITRALNSAFTLGVSQFTQGNILSRAFSDLLPSTSYYFKVEGSNSAGYGPASSTLVVTTVSGCYYSNGSTWLAAGIFVSDGTDWKPIEVFVSNGTAYIAAI